jgi:hypothetical protein
MDPSPPSASPSAESPNGQASSEASPTGSAPASTTSRAASGVFIDDPGPAFDARAAAAVPQPEPVAAEPLPSLMWEEQMVRGVLTAQGAALHMAVGVGESDWKYLETELDTIAGPLTRILNHYPATQALAAGGDAMAASIGFGAYGLRSILERRAVLAAREAGAEPITGVPAPPGADGASDPAQRAARGEAPDWQVETR